MLDCAGMIRIITSYILVFSAILAVTHPSICLAQDDVSGRVETNGILQTIILEAPSIVGSESEFSAEGPVVMHSGNKRISASSLTLDTIVGKAMIKDAVISSCAQTRPHFSIEAGRLSLTKSGWAEAHRLSIRLGRVRVLYLPWIRLHFSAQGGTRAMFPLVWYDANDGLSLSKNIVLFDNKRISSEVNAKLTSENGIQGLASLTYGIDGNLTAFPGRDLGRTYWAPGAIATFRDVMESFPVLCPVTLGSHSSRFRMYSDYAVKQRVDDVGDTAVTMFKRPEIGIRYIGQPIDRFCRTHDSRLTLLPAVDLSWSRLREEPSVLGSVERLRLSVAAAFNFINAGKNAAIQPVIEQVWYKYRNIRDYQVLTYGLDAGHIYQNGSHANIRYLARSGRGNAVFESDDVDVRHEIQASTTLLQGGHNLALMSAYDFDKRHLYDWEFGYGYVTDCLDVGAFYNGRLKRIGIKLVLKNL